MTDLTVPELYRRSCRHRGAAVFFSDAAERATGREAWDASLRLAAGFASLGVRQGDRVVFLCRPSVRHALAWFAGTLAGAVMCSLHVREQAARLGETIAWLDAALVVHDEALAPLARAALEAESYACPCVSLGEQGDAAASYDALIANARAVDPAACAPDDLAAIILSSGSTGRPKGVMHTHRTLVENAEAGQLLYGQVTVHDSTLVMMQPSFAAWVNVVLPYVGAKARIVFRPAFQAAEFLATLEAEAITMAPVPTMWRLALAESLPRRDLAAVRIVTISGEPPARSDLDRIRETVCRRIASVYLSSEGGCGCGVLATSEDLLGRGKWATTGKPAVGADVRIVAPDGAIDDELPRGETGEIAIAGPSLAVGYWKDEPLTRERFVGGWWRSGDLGRFDEDGDLYIVGRTDNLINSGGMKVHGEEIERALLAHPAVAQAVVVGMRDATWGQRVEAHVVLRAGHAVGTEALAAFCRGQGGLADFKVPKVFHFPSELPLGPTGKLYRRALRGE